MATALYAGPILTRSAPRPFRFIAISVSSLILSAGLVSAALQAAETELGFRWIIASGLGFAWGGSLLIATAIRLLWKRIPAPSDPGRRKLLALASAPFMAAPAVALGYGAFIGRRRFHLKEVDIPILNLAADLDGLRIAQLSDIHLSPFLSRADLQWCVAMANETRPHFAAVTGDLITGLYDPIDACLDDLRQLRTDAGIFGCNGNHEGYIGAEAYTADEADRRGMKFLRHQQTPLKFGSATINLAGIDHQYSQFQARLAGALTRPSELNLLLNHNPTVFPTLAFQGWDLILAGHMHGGQINVELANANWNLVRFSTPYVYGKYHEKGSTMFVTRGIGTIGMPVRIGADPEVALIRLRRA